MIIKEEVATYGQMIVILMVMMVTIILTVKIVVMMIWFTYGQEGEKITR
jgi:hypothetical protein